MPSGDEKLKDDMPVFGIGPFYVGIITLTSFILLVLDWLGFLPAVDPVPRAVCIAVALILIVLGAYMWYAAVFRDRVTDNIHGSTLVTTGIYAWVRNPIYSAFMFVNWGLLLLSGNLVLLIFIPVYWFLETVVVAETEELWLKQLHGDQYREYCKKVNRCIPWFPGKGT